MTPRQASHHVGAHGGGTGGLWRTVGSIALIGLPIAARFLVPDPVLVPAPYAYAGAPVMLAGLALMFWAWRLFKSNGTTLRLDGVPTSTFITWGPYRFSRNPMYLGALIALLGLSILLGAAAGFAFPVACFIAADRLMVRPEEEALARQLGPSYAEYRRRVRRWV